MDPADTSTSPRADLGDIIVTNQISGAFAWAEFHGTRAQLEAEELIPPCVTWPEGFNEVEWEAGELRYRLRRARPAGAKGPRKAFAAVDWWKLRSDRATLIPWEARALADKVAELQETRWAVSEAGQAARARQIAAWFEAERDTAFQAFKALTPGLCKPPRRRA
jgi:hypothetical protein